MRSFVVFAVLVSSLPAAAAPDVRVVAQTGAEISSIQFSPDGRYVVTTAGQGFIGSSRVWDAASGRLRQVFPGRVAAISRDGAVLATGGQWETVRLWDTATGELRRDLGADQVSELAFTPDGARVVASSLGVDNIRMWEAGTGRLLRQWKTETWATSLQVSPDGTFLFGAGSGGRLEIWDLETGRSRHSLSAHPQWTESLAVSGDGSLLATAGREGAVRLWETASGRLIRTLAEGEGKRSVVAMSADGRLVAAPGAPGRVTLWDREGRVVRELASGGAERFHAVAMPPDGRHVIAAARETFVWDAADGRLLHTLPGNAFAVSPDGLSLAVGHSRGCLQIVDLASGEKRATLCGRGEPAFGIAVTPDGRSLLASEWNVTHHWDLATGGPPGRLGGTYSTNSAAAAGSVVVTAGEVWDRSAGKRLRRLERRATAFAVSPDGAWIATAGGDGVVQISEAAGGRVRATLRGAASPVDRVAFSPDLSYVAVKAQEGTLSLWSLDGELLHTIDLGEDPALDALFVSPDGSFLITPAEEGRVDVWDARAGTLSRSLTGLYGQIGGLGLSPDGRSLAILTNTPSPGHRRPGEPKGPGVWDLASGRLRFSLASHPTGYRHEAVSFSGDGRFLATAGRDGTVQLWPAAGGAPLRTFAAPSGFEAVALGPSGAFLAGLRGDDAIVLWDTETGAELATLYAFEAGDWAVIAPDGRWDAAKGGHSPWVTVWEQGEPSSLAMHPELHVPGLLPAVLEGRNEPGELPGLAAEPQSPVAVPREARVLPSPEPASLRFGVRLLSSPRANGGAALSGSYAFLAGGERGLQVLDLADPSSPRVAACFDTPGYAQAVRLSGPVAYVSDGHEGLAILDVSNPAAPALLSRLAMKNGAGPLAVAGKMVYVADNGAGLQVVDASDPRAPRLAGSYEMPDGTFIRSVLAAGRHLYLGVNGVGKRGVMVLDVSNPSAPRLAGTWPMEELAGALAVDGTVAYVAAGDAGLIVLDLSDPAAPVRLARIDMPAANGVVVAGGFLYLSDYYLGLRIFDVSDPAHPAVVGVLDLDELTTIAVAGDLVVASAGCSGTRVLGLSRVAGGKP